MILRITFLLLLFSTQVWAKSALSHEEAVALVETYLNNITTYQAQFRQTTLGNPVVQEGAFYLKRPRQFLWQYYVPYKQKLVSTGGQLFYEDQETGHVTQLPLNSGVASFLTQKKIQLASQDTWVVNIVEEKGFLAINLGFTDESAPVKTIKMVFERAPIKLRQLITTDQMDTVTFMEFEHIQEGQKLANKLFEFVPPHYREN